MMVGLCYFYVFLQFSSVTQSCPTLCNPMDCSTPGFTVLQHLPEFAQTYVHRVGDAIQPSHPLWSPSPPSILHSSKVFSNKSVLPITCPKYWIFSFSISPSNEYSGLISLRIGWFDLLAVQGTLKSLLQSLNPPHIPVNNSPQLSLIERHLFPTGFWLIQLALESLHSATTPLSITVAALESRSPSYETHFDLLLVIWF